MSMGFSFLRLLFLPAFPCTASGSLRVRLSVRTIPPGEGRAPKKERPLRGRDYAYIVICLHMSTFGTIWLRERDLNPLSCIFPAAKMLRSVRRL